jgi:preprotein translocase subunit SecG
MMGALSIALLIFFVFIAFLLVLLVLVQNDEGGGLGGVFGGGSGSAFGSRSGNILTKTTTVLGSLFLIISLGLALMNRTPTGTGVEAAGFELMPGAGVDWFLEDDVAPVPETDVLFVPEADAGDGTLE